LTERAQVNPFPPRSGVRYSNSSIGTPYVVAYSYSMFEERPARTLVTKG
jgi:hypothetical protein